MPLIHVLDEPTINQIAAGEVVERPSAVVKELIENAMDAGATAITAEIKEGGLSFIRITDNGAGIAKEDIPLAFLRHATSKIRTAEDLLSVTSLGFRGEALSSIAAVAQVELITKTPSALNGYRYIMEGSEEKSLEEIGCPGGTTIIVRNLFYNTPARRKFLKSAMTEAGYISDLMERLMVSHPGISFKFILNNQVKLQSSGNSSSKDILYQVYGRDITRELLSVSEASEELQINGFIGKPVITRGNRNYENYYINGRYIKSSIITKAIEEAYKPFLMQHKYPFTSLYIEIDPSRIDVNVHPQKLELRLKDGEEIYRFVYDTIRSTLAGKEMIPRVSLLEEPEEKKSVTKSPEPFEENRRKQEEAHNRPLPGETMKAPPAPSAAIPPVNKPDTVNFVNTGNTIRYDSNPSSINRVAEANPGYPTASSGNPADISDPMSDITQAKPVKVDILHATDVEPVQVEKSKPTLPNNLSSSSAVNITNSPISENNREIKVAADLSSKVPLYTPQVETVSQMNLFTDPESGASPFLSKKALEEHRIIGQLFSTYWLVEYKKELYIIDQHAAHEKVLYERTMVAARNKTFEAQQLLPPIVLTLTLREQEVLHKFEEVLNSLGYEFEHFGGNEYSVRAVPADLYSISEKDLLLEFIDDLAEEITGSITSTSSILERVASLSCKAAIKANHTLTYDEASSLIRELLTLENPYNCPHGRPVIISMSQYELERKFKRII